MPKTQIVIEIERGFVTAYAPDPSSLNVILLDWDGDSVDPAAHPLVELPGRGGSTTTFAVDVPVRPLGELAGSDTERAIDIACERGFLADEELIPC